MDKYKCWDCEKEIEDVNFDEETKKKCPRDINGVYFIICNDCKDNDD
jgi:phage FluMu protein Com